jgi:VanZ family protein
VVDPTAGSSVGRAVVSWLPAALWAALIFLLSAQSEPPDPAGLAGTPGWSQAAHFGLYLVLGALLYIAFRGAGCRVRGAGEGSGSGVQGAGGWKRPMTGAYLLALAAGALYAATDEVHQYFVPMRQADVLDWIVDVAGVLAGALAVLALEHRRAKL